jgi:uroporphyrinogen decarboxylase
MLALNHKEADRVPIDFGSTYMTSITELSYLKLESALGYPVNQELFYPASGAELNQPDRPPCLQTPLSRVVLPREELLHRFRVDTRGVPRPDAPASWRNVQEDGSVIDEFGCQWKQASGQAQYSFYRGPFEGHPTLSDLQTHPWPDDPENPQRFVGRKDLAQRLYHDTEYAVMASVPGGFLTWAQFLRGAEGFYLDLAADPKFITSLMDRMVDFILAIADKLLDEIGPSIQIICYGDDLAFQNGLMMSMPMFRQLIKPRLRRVFDFFRSKSQAKLWFHTDGAIVPLLPDIIDLGVDILNPIQVTASGMDDTRRLKQEFGNDLVFWGGIDTQQLLPFGTPQKVRADVQRRIWDLAADGGYVLSSVHNIQDDVSPENIIAMFDEAYTVGTYPLANQPSNFNISSIHA